MTIMKNKFFAIVLFCLLTCVGKAQTVDYTYKPLAAEGCNVKYSVTKQDTTYYIIATVKSEMLSFLKEPTMLIKNFDGQVIKLYGNNIGNGSETGGVLIGNIIITEISSTAQFKITPEQFESIKNGISKVRLSTTPIEHEREFSKDKIGKKLYQFYLKQRDKDDKF